MSNSGPLVVQILMKSRRHNSTQTHLSHSSDADGNRGPVRVTHLSASCSPKTIQINAQHRSSWSITISVYAIHGTLCVCVIVLPCNLYKLLLSSLSLKSHFAHISSQAGRQSAPNPIRSLLPRSPHSHPHPLRPWSCQAYKLLYDIVLNLRDK